MTATGRALTRKRRVKPLPPIAGRQFQTVAELEDAINQIRKTYRPHDEPVRGADAALIMAYMRHHDSIEDAEQVYGELRHICITHNKEVFRGRGRPECDQYQIRLVFADGRSVPFSYKSSYNNFGVLNDGCVASRRRLRWINRAGRCLIVDEIREYLNVHLEFDGTCELSGKALTPDTADVHHAGLSFQWLLFGFLVDWCQSTGADPNAIAVRRTDDVGGHVFEDDALCDAWLAYHANHAQLQVLDKEVHFQQHVGATKPPWAELFAPSPSPPQP